MNTLFPKNTRTSLMASVVIIVLAIVLSVAGVGLNTGLDISGGSTITYVLNTSYEEGDIAAMLQSAGVSEYAIRKSGTSAASVVLYMGEAMNQVRAQEFKSKMDDLIAAKYPEANTEDAQVRSVGDVATWAMVGKVALSMLVALLAVMAYVAIRFDLYAALAAGIGIAYEVAMLVAVTAVLGIFVSVNLSYIVVLALAICFSAICTVVVFDKIRQNKQSGKVANLSKMEIVEKSAKEAKCSVFTIAGAALLISVAVCALGIGDVSTISLFVPIIIAVLIGACSALTMNGYVWAALSAAKKPAAKGKANVKAKPVIKKVVR